MYIGFKLLKFSFCPFFPGQKVFLPYRQKLGNYRVFYCDGEKPANPVHKHKSILIKAGHLNSGPSSYSILCFLIG